MSLSNSFFHVLHCFVSFSPLIEFSWNSHRHSFWSSFISLIFLIIIFWIPFLGFHPLQYHYCLFMWSYWLLEKSCCLMFSYFLEFVHLKPSHWLGVLATCSLLVEIFSVFTQDSLVAHNDVLFLTTRLGLWLSCPALAHILKPPGLLSSNTQIEVN
jgi:hypothetical protein